MYDVKVKNNKVFVILGSIFLIVGIIIFLVLGFLTYSSFTKKNELQGETNVIDYVADCDYDSDDNYMCSPTFTYEVDGTTYKCSSNIRTSGTNFDKYKVVYYDETNPSKCMSEYDVKTGYLFLLFILLPTIFIAVGLGCLIYSKVQVKKIKSLSNKGVLVKNLPFVVVDSGIEVMNKRIPKLKVEFTFPNGDNKVLYSLPFYDDSIIQQNQTVDLLYDPDDYNNYYIDFNIG